MHTANSNRMPVVLDTRVVCGSGGGPDKTILNSPRFLAKCGYRMLCGYLHAPDDRGVEQLRRKAELKEAPWISVPDNGPCDWRILPRLVDLCRRENVAIWHGHDYKTNFLGLLVRRFWPMRLVTTVHGWVQHTRRTPLYYWIDRVSLRFYEKVFCVSDDLYHHCRASGVEAAKCEVLENGIDLEEHTRTELVEDAKIQLGLDPRRILIGAAGRLSAEKGFDILIRAVAQLRDQRLNPLLVIAGEGAEKSQLQRVIADLNLSDNVRMVGYQANMKPWYQAMDVFALSSLREGLPNVVLEAMALEVPIVATNIAGLPRLIQSEINGLLVEPGDTSSLTRALSRLLADSDMRARLRQAGRSTLVRHYNFADRMTKLRRFYDRLLAKDGSSDVLSLMR